jgi:hypothetical protein
LVVLSRLHWTVAGDFAAQVSPGLVFGTEIPGGLEVEDGCFNVEQGPHYCPGIDNRNSSEIWAGEQRLAVNPAQKLRRNHAGEGHIDEKIDGELALFKV